VRKLSPSERQAPAIWWRIVREWAGVGLTFEAAKAAERPPKLTVHAIPALPDFDGTPVQIIPFNRRRREVVVSNTGLYPFVLLRSRTSDVADGFTVKPGKIKLKCRAAMWATCAPAYPFGTTAVVLETLYGSDRD
jgi:hypothetical protein